MSYIYLYFQCSISSPVLIIIYQMTQEERCQTQNYPQYIYQDLKIRYEHTALFTKEKQNSQSPFKCDHILSNQTESSFENGIHQENIQKLKQASIRFLDDCFVQKYDQEQGFKNKFIFEDVPFQLGGFSDMENLTIQNELLLPGEREEWLMFLKENQDFKNMLKIIVPTFGITVGKQMVYIFYRLLKLKFQAYREIAYLKQPIIPKFNCFLGFQDETFDCPTSCPIYEDLNAQQISQFAQSNLQEFNNAIYFAKEVQFITLKKAKLDVNGNILSKMLPFIKQLSKTMFLTIAGISEPQYNPNSDLFSVSLSRDTSLNMQIFNQRPLLTVHRSQSRPSVPYQQEQVQDFLSKKQKFM